MTTDQIISFEAQYLYAQGHERAGQRAGVSPFDQQVGEDGRIVLIDDDADRLPGGAFPAIRVSLDDVVRFQPLTDWGASRPIHYRPLDLLRGRFGRYIGVRGPLGYAPPDLPPGRIIVRNDAGDGSWLHGPVTAFAPVVVDV